MHAYFDTVMNTKFIVRTLTSSLGLSRLPLTKRAWPDEQNYMANVMFNMVLVMYRIDLQYSLTRSMGRVTYNL